MLLLRSFSLGKGLLTNLELAFYKYVNVNVQNLTTFTKFHTVRSNGASYKRQSTGNEEHVNSSYYSFPTESMNIWSIFFFLFLALSVLFVK